MLVSLSCSGVLLDTSLLDTEVHASYNNGRTYVWVPNLLLSFMQCLSYTTSVTMHSSSSHCSLTVSPTQEEKSAVARLVAVDVDSMMVQQQSSDCKGEARGTYLHEGSLSHRVQL